MRASHGFLLCTYPYETVRSLFSFLRPRASVYTPGLSWERRPPCRTRRVRLPNFLGRLGKLGRQTLTASLEPRALVG